MIQIIAHRGYGQPENTMQAFLRAKKIGADGIELDTYLSAGGEWIIDHLGKKLPTSNAERERESALPRLEEIKGLEGLEINVELKVPASEKDHASLGSKLMKFLQDNFELSNLHLSSFYPKTFIGVRKVDPEFRVSLLSLYSRRQTWEKWHRKVNLYSYNPFHKLFRTKHIPYLHKLGIRVHPWTVNSSRSIEKLMRDGVDAIITDVPEDAQRIRSSLETQL